MAANNQIPDIERGCVELAVRYCPAGMALKGVRRLFGQEVLSICAPALRCLGGQLLLKLADMLPSAIATS